ncbi:MAG TPA: AGE family epimerase/isomerase, partial [Caulobacteraceae bacterium]|nr:AGE family epimerase/isomerase [Caulobacteraceae bacterium]
APARVRDAAARLKRWLLEAALPIWWARAADREGGGYFDRLNLDGTVAANPKRLRVQARQAYVYALAPGLGWSGPAKQASRHGLIQMMSHKCDDGLFRTRPDEPAPRDGMGLLYDQAFVMLALASDLVAFGDHDQQRHALAVLRDIAAFAHPRGGYAEAPGLPEPLFGNPNMHLFESAQAWMRAKDGGAWDQLAAGLARFACERLIDPASGAMLERFGPDWQAPAAAAERFVWPGHLYEWAFLLLDRPRVTAGERAAALRLIEVSEERGVDRARGIVIFALDDQLAPLDRGARLWAQTERLRACTRAAAIAGDGSQTTGIQASAMWDAVAEAIGALDAFLDVPTRGLWRDWMGPDGAFVDEPAPASSLYHIAGAIAELVRQTSAPP